MPFGYRIPLVPPVRIYLDHNATAPLHPAARAATCAALELRGNASSIHAEGRAARSVIEDARATIAAFAGVAAKNVVLTSGGTEALNLALTPHIETRNDKRPFSLLLAGAGEHLCVLAGNRFPAGRVERVGLTREGVIDLEALATALSRAAASGHRFMLALQAANNETGVIQPVAAAAEMVHAANGFLVCDAVQAAGRIECSATTLAADALILSAHKFGGPKGVGAVCFQSDDTHIRDPLLRGGGQERGLRAGTENIAAIAGMAAATAAAKERLSKEASAHAAWRDELESLISRLAPEAVFLGRGAERLPNTSCFALPFIDANVLLISLDLEGIAVSSGSACSSGVAKTSHVLAAMGVEPKVARGAIRVSLGWNSRREDCVALAQALERTVGRIKARRQKPAA
jgi:cysteine desulfurase